LSFATLAPGASCTFSVNVTGTTTGTKVNTTFPVTSVEGGNGNRATATLTVDPPSPPQIRKAFGAKLISLGGSTSLSFDISNVNPVALTGVAFTDTMPPGLVVSTPNRLTGTCAGGTITANPGSGSVTLSGATLNTGACTFSVDVTATSNGVKNNSVSVTSTNAGTGNTATATLTVGAPLPPAISKAFGTTSIAVDGSTRLSFTVTNPNAVNLEGVAFTDTLPSGLVVSTPNRLQLDCRSVSERNITATAGSGSVAMSSLTLLSGDSCTFSVNVTATTTGVKNNSVTVTSTNAGTGNTATATLTVTAPSPPGRATISKDFDATSIRVGDSARLTFTVANGNSTLVNQAAFTDTLPPGLVVSTPNGFQGGCVQGSTITATAGSHSVSLSGANLLAFERDRCTFSVEVTATSAGVKNNSVTVTSEGGAGNTATATLTVVAVSPPTISKAFSAASIPVDRQGCRSPSPA
jgi:trimeric autotransporter adhesin